uniref:RIIa domain-containing protein n=1 Tax=Xiphophorus couchianus TaxID=32473 RepID=A0A3B5L5Z3_9TELE
MSNVEIPAGLKELLQGYTVEVLRRRPPNLVEFAVQHFTRILEKQKNEQQARKNSSKPAAKEVTLETASNKSNENDEDEEVKEAPSEKLGDCTSNLLCKTKTEEANYCALEYICKYLRFIISESF